MKRMNIWMLSALLALPASAQKITTQHEVVDCGQVVFHKPVTAEFVLKNDGHKPLVINNVLKSCGCTEVDYPKTSIAAGESFVIKAVYDAKQMGTFTKQVCLYTNADEEPFILSMRGRVVGSVVDFAGSYDEMLGVIKSDAQEVEFDDVNRGDRPRHPFLQPSRRSAGAGSDASAILSSCFRIAFQGGSASFCRNQFRAGFQETARPGLEPDIGLSR